MADGRRGRPTALTPEAIDIAADVASRCPSYVAIARAIGVGPTTIRDWLRRGRSKDHPEIYQRFYAVIQDALAKAEIRLAEKISTGEPRDAAWMLTHSPFFREEWSDAAAERRAVQKALQHVVTAIESTGLSQEQKTHLFLAMQAQGLGAMGPAATADDPDADD